MYLTCNVMLVSGMKRNDAIFVYTAKWPPS